MGLEEPRLSLVRTNSIDQTCITETTLLPPIPKSAGADVVLIGEIADHRIHALNSHSAHGAESRAESFAAAGEFQQGSDGLQPLHGRAFCSAERFSRSVTLTSGREANSLDWLPSEAPEPCSLAPSQGAA